MHNPEPEQLIAASALFRNLQPEEAQAVIARLHAVTCRRGERIIERGQWHGQFYLLATGAVSVLLQEDAEAGEVVVTRLGPGECFGEMSLITGEPPTATIRAEQDCTLWSLSQADFLALVGACPTLPRNINHILSQRLARTNQQMLAAPRAECTWLNVFANSPARPERSLVVHIAQALAGCSQKRVLLLELCPREQSILPRFASHEHQMRPGLLACMQSSEALQAHHSPTRDDDGQHFPALAMLTDGPNEETPQEIEQSGMGRVQATLRALAALYDYLLLVTAPTTPDPLVQSVAGHCQRAIVLVSAHEETLREAKAHALPPPAFSGLYSLFVAHVPEAPTIGAQDRYAALLGIGTTATPPARARLERLLPADTPLLERCWQQGTTLTRIMPEAPLTRAVDFVARFLARQTVGIAFGGGGARGFAHIGVLKRLLECGVPLDYISACSIGLIAPCMYLMGRPPNEIEETFMSIQRHITQWRIPRTSLFSNERLKRAFQELAGPLRFEDLTTPFAVVAVDLATHAGVILDRGPIWLAGLASVALPGIFPPVVIGEHVLVDAGMYDPVPVSVVRNMGADILIASELAEQPAPVHASARPWLVGAEQAREGRAPHIVDLLLRSYDMAMATIGKHSVRDADIVIHPQLHRVSLRQFSEGRKFIAAGYAATGEMLPALQKRLPWLIIRPG